MKLVIALACCFAVVLAAPRRLERTNRYQDREDDFSQEQPENENYRNRHHGHEHLGVALPPNVRALEVDPFPPTVWANTVTSVNLSAHGQNRFWKVCPTIISPGSTNLATSPIRNCPVA